MIFDYCLLVELDLVVTKMSQLSSDNKIFQFLSHRLFTNFLSILLLSFLLASDFQGSTIHLLFKQILLA